MTVTAVNAPEQSAARPGIGRMLEIRIGPFGGTIGIVVIAIGLLVIGLGWNGAAGSGSYVNGVPDIRAQLPWLISGGGLGLALGMVGVGLMVTQAQRADRARLEARIQELADALQTVSGGSGAARLSGAASSPAAPARTSRAAATNSLDVVVAGATSYHRSDCRLAKGRGARRITRAEAETEGLKACRICHPEE